MVCFAEVVRKGKWYRKDSAQYGNQRIDNAPGTGNQATPLKAVSREPKSRVRDSARSAYIQGQSWRVESNVVE